MLDAHPRDLGHIDKGKVRVDAHPDQVGQLAEIADALLERLAPGRS